MRRIALPILALLASIAFLVPSLAAAAGPPPTYIVGKIGGYFPMASDVDNFDSDFLGEVAVGYYIAPGFAVEGGIGYFETKGRMSGPPAADHTFEVYPLTFSLRGVVPYGPFEAYGMAGIGVYFVDDQRTTAVSSGSDSAADIGFHLGLGGKYTLPNNVFFGLEGKYLWLSTSTFGSETRLDGAILTATVGYRF
jgi:opacity protein-like surface antigen